MATPAQTQSFNLFGSGVSVGDNIMTLVEFNGIPADSSSTGTPLTMADFGTKGFGTVDPGNGAQEESISFTGVQVNPDGTRSLTGIKSVGFTSPYTETTGFAKSHAGGARFVISNTSAFYNDFISKSAPNTITAVQTFSVSPIVPTPTTSTQAANKNYVDVVTTAGAPDASDATKGITKLNIAPASPTDPIAVGANDVSATPAADKIIRANGSGKLPQTWLDLAASWVFTGVVDITANLWKLGGVAFTGTMALLNEATTFFNATDITGAEAESLTDGSTIANLHFHKKSYGVTTGNGSTTQNIAHGLGVTPSRIRITAKNGITTATATNSVASTGVMAAGTAPATVIQANGAIIAPSTAVIISCHNNNVTRTATAVLNSTNIVLTWSNALNTEISILWEAEA